MANVTVTTAANLIPELWGPLLLKEYEAAQKFRALVRALEVEGGYGDTIHIPVITALTADTKVAGTDLTPVANTEGKVDVSLNIHKAKAVKVEDIAEVQAKWDLLSVYAGQIGTSLGRAVDASLAALVTSCSTEVDASTTTVANLHTKVLELKATFDAADAPEQGRYLCVTPTAAQQLLANPYFISKDYRGDVEAVAKGVIGMIYGFTIVISNALPSNQTGEDYNFAFVSEAVGLAIQRDITLRASQIAESLATTVAGDIIYGCGILIQDGVAQFTTSYAAYTG
jgi:N4-gp56 family major capsid protein